MKNFFKNSQPKDELEELLKDLSNRKHSSTKFTAQLRREFLMRASSKPAHSNLLMSLRLKTVFSLAAFIFVVSVLALSTYQLNQPKDYSGLITKIYAANADLYDAFYNIPQEFRDKMLIHTKMTTTIGSAYEQCIVNLDFNKVNVPYADKYEVFEYYDKARRKDFPFTKAVASRDGQVISFTLSTPKESITYNGGKYAIVEPGTVGIFPGHGESDEAELEVGSISDQAQIDFIPAKYSVVEQKDAYIVSWEQEAYCANKQERTPFSIRTEISVDKLSNKILSTAIYNSANELMSKNTLTIERIANTDYTEVKKIFKFDLDVELRNYDAASEMPSYSVDEMRKATIKTQRAAIDYLLANPNILLIPDSADFEIASFQKRPQESVSDFIAQIPGYYKDRKFYPNGELGEKIMALSTTFQNSLTEAIFADFEAGFSPIPAANQYRQGLNLSTYMNDTQLETIVKANHMQFYPLERIDDTVVAVNGQNVVAQVYRDSKEKYAVLENDYVIAFESGGYKYVVQGTGEGLLKLSYRSKLFTNRSEIIDAMFANPMFLSAPPLNLTRRDLE